jgi:hypothetical protein
VLWTITIILVLHPQCLTLWDMLSNISHLAPKVFHMWYNKKISHIMQALFYPFMHSPHTCSCLSCFLRHTRIARTVFCLCVCVCECVTIFACNFHNTNFLPFICLSIIFAVLSSHTQPNSSSTSAVTVASTKKWYFCA